MTDKLGSTIDKYFEGSSDLNKKQVYIPYNIQLFSILNDTITVTDENSIITYEKFSSVLMGEELQKTSKTYTIRLNPEIITELIQIGSCVTDFILLTQKLFLFYIKHIRNKIKIFKNLIYQILKQLTVIKFIFTIRSD